MHQLQRVLVIVCVGVILSGCGGAQSVTPGSSDGVQSEPFRWNALGKSDVDMVTDIHVHQNLNYLRLLMVKLYRRNPSEWRKNGSPNLEAAVRRVFGPPIRWTFPELQGKRSVQSMQLAFEDGYQGDRVLALVAGIGGMLMDAYNGKQEVFLIDQLDPQKLYDSARNIEIAAWKLGHDRDPEGRLYLLANETSGPVTNLSFERLMGKMIALQDSMARIVADTTNRRVKKAIQFMATKMFIPI
jgi:hypothetical protein